MGYADNVRSSTRPACWGNTLSYDQNDIECAECRFRHSCDVETKNKGGGRIHVSSNPVYGRTNYSSKNCTSPDIDAGTNQPAVIEPNEKPAERFAKDALGGGLRGMFYEMWQFWRHYRIR